MRLYINQKILFGLFSIIFIIFALGLASFWYSSEVIRASRQGSQSQLLVYCSEQIRSLLLTLEPTQLQSEESINNGNHSHSFERLVQVIENRMQELDSLSLSNPTQQQPIKLLHAVVREKIQTVRKALEIRTGSEMALDTTVENQNKLLRYQANQLIDEIQVQENILKRERATKVTIQFSRFAFSFLGLLASCMVILSILIYSLNTNLKARTKAEEKLKVVSASNYDLYENAPCGYFSFDKEGMFTGINQTLLAWLGYHREKVVHRFHLTNVFSSEIAGLYSNDLSDFRKNGFIQDLEANVICQDQSSFPVIINAVALVNSKGQYLGGRCTLVDNSERKKAENNAKLLANELEAFTYSVSHDLRAPLRSINGYTQILIEDHLAQLDEAGVRVINTIIKNATRMGNLIDDLLNFSHTNRRNITKSNIKMTEFVTQIANELKDNEKGRQVQIEIGELSMAWADHSMLRQVWINLISNALKYSRKRETTIIDIRAIDKVDETIYLIQDNGVGFEMKYYDKLFGVFSRLHKQEDFEGTGVGLSLTQRIVQRHDGQIWAESKEGEGATFFFSIPKQKQVNQT